MSFFDLFRKPAEQALQDPGEKARALKTAEDKRQRKRAKAIKLLQRDAHRLSPHPVYVPWNTAAKELGLEKVGVDYADRYKRDISGGELFEAARLEEKQ